MYLHTSLKILKLLLETYWNYRNKQNFPSSRNIQRLTEEKKFFLSFLSGPYLDSNIYSLDTHLDARILGAINFQRKTRARESIKYKSRIRLARMYFPSDCRFHYFLLIPFVSWHVLQYTFPMYATICAQKKESLL